MKMEWRCTVHQKPVAVGDEVDVTIDWDRRWAHATQHRERSRVASLICEDWLGAPTLSRHLGETDATVELGSPFTARTSRSSRAASSALMRDAVSRWREGILRLM